MDNRLEPLCSTPSQPAQVLIVDDHPLIRRGLGVTISQEPDLKVCGEAGSVAETLRILESQHVDLLILDLTLDDGHGLDLLKHVRNTWPATRVLAVSMHDENLFAERVLHMGGRGYVHKERSLDEIVLAIRETLAGGIYVTSHSPGKTSEPDSREPSELAAQHDSQPAPGVELLSDRELTVFALLGRGSTTKQIAEQLGLSHKTVETHRERIKKKLNLSRGPALVKRAVEWCLQEEMRSRED